MSTREDIPDQVRLPLSVALGVVRQGIRIRLGRSLVTLIGVILGIAFLMATLTAQALKRGVSDEDRLRQQASRMYGYLVAETGPLLKRPLALVVTSRLSPPEQRLLSRLTEEGVSELRSWNTKESTQLSSLGAVNKTSEASLGDEVPAVLVLGNGDLPKLDWQTLLNHVRQPIVATTRERTLKIPGSTRVRLSRPLSFEERVRLDKESQRDRFRGLWIIAISLLVTVIGISNAMLMSVTERFRDIGTMKCLGALSSFVRTIFLIEALLMGVIGGAFGVLFGFTFAALSYFLPYGPVLSLQALAAEPGWLLLASVFSLIAGVVLSIIAALYPASLAARMVPADALRSNV